MEMNKALRLVAIRLVSKDPDIRSGVVANLISNLRRLFDQHGVGRNGRTLRIVAGIVQPAAFLA